MSISDVLAEYDAIRRKNQREEQRRRQEVYTRAPRLSALHARINTLQLVRLREALTGGDLKSDDIYKLRHEALDLLTESGFDANYLDPIFSCPVCRDTGVRDDAQRCSCFLTRVLEDKLDTARLTDSYVSFEQFDFNVFSSEPLEKGKSQRELMAHIKSHCEKYADEFPKSAQLLVMAGSAGLGKTYIVKCIMRRIIERGYTSAYFTAYRLFSFFHQDRMGESVDLDPLFDVPLLIIDDLGTEPMTRNVTIEYFFDLLNERNAAGLHTIIVTNLGFHEIKDHYGERIHSRLMDTRHSQKILFKGSDVRISSVL